jgi:hypothetical protein
MGTCSCQQAMIADLIFTHEIIANNRYDTLQISIALRKKNREFYGFEFCARKNLPWIWVTNILSLDECSSMNYG